MPSKLIISIFLVFLFGCKGKAQKNIADLAITDTCIEFFQLDEKSMDEYLKHSMGIEVDTSLFYNKVCNCISIDTLSNGQIHSKGIMKNCQPEGAWVTYGDSNKVYNITTYKAGVRDGEFITYHNNGQLALKCYYTNNQYDGLYRRYDPTGRLLEEIVFKNSVVVSKKVYHDWQDDWVKEYIWPDYTDEMKKGKEPGVYIWYGGEMVLLRKFTDEELKTNTADFDLTEEAQDKFYEDKKKNK